uniref:Uncharacterized protein n=1 Tax=Molossus molossus TaxID=27622 RepID=A0A7J8J0I6_MOLMO|nr:hypothetical protein HJG59_010405 [Molossus molossus]
MKTYKDPGSLKYGLAEKSRSVSSKNYISQGATRHATEDGQRTRVGGPRAASQLTKGQKRGSRRAANLRTQARYYLQTLKSIRGTRLHLPSQFPACRACSPSESVGGHGSRAEILGEWRERSTGVLPLRPHSQASLSRLRRGGAHAPGLPEERRGSGREGPRGALGSARATSVRRPAKVGYSAQVREDEGGERVPTRQMYLHKMHRS